MDSKPLIITVAVVEGFIRGYNLVPPLCRYKAIDDDASELLADSDIPLDLDGVSVISSNAIFHLVKRQDNLCLGISKITSEQAKALGGCRKKLSLNKLEEVSLSVLKILVSTPRDFLSLDGLKTLTSEQANLLSQFQGDLSLEGISQLNEELAKHLARHTGSLSLGKLKALTTEEARHLTGHQGNVLLDATLEVPRAGSYLIRRHFDLKVGSYSQANYVEDCLTDGTDDAIAMARNSLATCGKTLCLDAMNDLQCSGAEVLARFPGELQLPVLEALDPTVAALLAEHNGPALVLDGLRSMTVPVASALGKHRGALSLRGITSFEEGSLPLLALHAGSLTLPLPDGGNEKYGWFKVDCRRVVWNPSGIDQHDLAVVGEILQTDPAEIEIPDEVHFVSNTVLARLGYACRVRGIGVAIPGLRQINQQQCHLLTGNHLEKAHTSGVGRLALDGLLELADQVADELGKSGLRLSLSSLSHLSSGVLRRLTQNIRSLTLNGMHAVDEEGCKYLASVPGELHLDKIEILRAGCAAAISGHKGRLALNGLQAICEEDARELSRHEGTVELKGIRVAKMNSALLNGFIRGSIILDELEIFHFICEYGGFIGRKPSRNSGNSTEGSGHDDTAMPELVVRLLIEYLSMCLYLVERSRFRSSPVILMQQPGASPDRQILAELASYRQYPPQMAIDYLISYVTEKYFDQEVMGEANEYRLLIRDERKMFDRGDRRQVVFQNFYGIAGERMTSCRNDINSYCPELKPIIKSCFRSAKRIMCSGLTGESNISCPTLVVLGCLLGERVDLPEVHCLCCSGAKALTVLEAELVLNGIKELSPEIALLLSEHEGINYWADDGYQNVTIFMDTLELNGIKSLDPETAAALSRHRGGMLRLNGLTSLSDEASENLGSHTGSWRSLELQGIHSFSPRAAQALSHCLDQDPWCHVDADQIEARFSEAMLDWQSGKTNQVAGVLGSFIDLAFLLVHQGKNDELETFYGTLLSSIESRLGKVSMSWVSCVVCASRVRAGANNNLSCVQLIIQETEPLVEALINASSSEWEQGLRLVELVAEAGEANAAHALLERAIETIKATFSPNSGATEAANMLKCQFKHTGYRSDNSRLYDYNKPG